MCQDLLRKEHTMDWRKKGFTLIELLVVISVIAVLMGILLPALNRVRKQARAGACLATLKGFALTNIAYASSNEGRFVPFSQRTSRPTTLPGKYIDERWVENREFRKTLAHTRKIKKGDLTSEWNDPWVFPKGLLCPSFPAKEIRGSWDDDPGFTQFLGTCLISYALNREQWAQDGWFPADLGYRGHSQSKIKRPGEKIMFIDSNYAQTMRFMADWESYWDVHGESLNWSNYGQICYRHRGGRGANIAFFDGHTGYLDKEVVYNTSLGTSANPDEREPDPHWDVNR